MGTFAAAVVVVALGMLLAGLLRRQQASASIDVILYLDYISPSVQAPPPARREGAAWRWLHSRLSSSGPG